MMSDPTYEPTHTLKDSAYEEDHGLGEAIACGMLTLGAPSLIAIGLIIGLVFAGVNPLLIEKGMVWLSVPWFALCYAWCRRAHRTKIVFVDENEDDSFSGSAS